MSFTVTVAVHVSVFKLPSVAVSVTVFGPTSEHVNAVWSRPKVTAPHVSLDPLFTSSATVDPFPEPSSSTVRFWQTAVGLVVSWTITNRVHGDDVLFDSSVVVQLTVVAPSGKPEPDAGEQVGVEAVLHSSDVVGSANVAVVEPPVHSTVTLAGQVIVGGVVSVSVQAQVKLPGVLMQASLTSQLCVPSVHSLTSKQEKPSPL